MPRRKKYTARGTLRLTKKQRSQIMKEFWNQRREAGSAPPAKPTKPVDEVRSKRMKASWRRRRRAGTAPAKKRRILLTHEERSEISKAAARKRKRTK
jgi:hypothetical protein